MVDLGHRLAELGRDDEAKEWMRHAADLADADAMVTLGHRLAELGRDDLTKESDRYYAHRGQADTMVNLGVLLRGGMAGRGRGRRLRRRGDEASEWTEAEGWWRRAADWATPTP